MKLFNLIVAVSLFGLPLVAAAPNPYDFNVYTIHNIGSQATPYGSAIQGIIGAGGNANLGGFSANTIGAGFPYSVYTGGKFYSTGGSVYNGGVQASGVIQSSNTSIYGNVTGGSSLQGSGGNIFGNVSVAGNNTSTISVSGTVSTSQPFTPSVNFSNVASYFQSASAYWGSLSSTTTVNNVFGQLQVSGLTSGRNIVNLTLAQLSGAWGILLNAPSSAFVIFNITDATPTTQLVKDVTFSLNGGISSSNVIYNLVNATQLSLLGGQYLSILAPNASITFPSGMVTGNLIADNLYGSGAISSGTFTGFQSDQSNFVSVPEPSTYALLAGCLLFLALVRKKRMQSLC